MKKHRESDRGGGDMLEGDGPRKNSSCFSNIKIFLISECALMLAQGTVGAYLVSATQAELTYNSLTRYLLCNFDPAAPVGLILNLCASVLFFLHEVLCHFRSKNETTEQ